MLLDAADPSRVLWRAPPSRCWPRTPTRNARHSSPNVVFPTAIEEIDGTHYVFYGMADSAIGVARLDRISEVQRDAPTGRRCLATAELLAAGCGRRPVGRAVRAAAASVPRRRRRRPSHAAPLTNLAHLDSCWPRCRRRPQRRPHHLPARRSTRRSACCGSMPTTRPTAPSNDVGGGTLRPGDRTPTARAPTTPTTSPGPPWCTCGSGGPHDAASRQQAVPAAARADLSADRVRPARRQRGALDAAGRHPQPEPDPGGQPRPVRLRCRRTGWPGRIWALGEGYAAFRSADPAFAAFLRARLDLASPRCTARCWSATAQFQTVHGARAPAWLIVDGADASSEAVLGLSATCAPAVPAAARTALAQLADGIARLRRGRPADVALRCGPAVGASPSDWHAWAAQMPAALALAAGGAAAAGPAGPGDRRMPRASRRTCSRRPVPDNGWLPTPGRRLPDRLRRRLPGCSPCSRWPMPPPRAACGRCRHRRGLVLRPEPRRRADLRPGDRRQARRRQPRRHAEPELRRGVDHPWRC